MKLILKHLGEERSVLAYSLKAQFSHVGLTQEFAHIRDDQEAKKGECQYQ